MRKAIIVIPARFESSRLPGKPLIEINGVPLVIRVWQICTKVKEVTNDDIIVATDDERIAKCCSKYGARYIMTSPSCLTGTDRIAEVSMSLESALYINVQGDEPMINPEDISKIIQAATKDPEKIINAYTKINHSEEFYSKTVPKVVFDLKQNLLYMSRGPIVSNKNHDFIIAWKQVCIYSFSKKHLSNFSEYGKKNGKTPLENQEDIEILRFLEMGYKVKMVEVSSASIAVDVPADIIKVENAIKENL